MKNLLIVLLLLSSFSYGQNKIIVEYENGQPHVPHRYRRGYAVQRRQRSRQGYLRDRPGEQGSERV